jgi:predicted PurR-regulated permease PerM
MSTAAHTGFLADRRTQAVLIILTLGVVITVAAAPFIPGLIGAPVLAVVFTPLHVRLKRRCTPGVAASLTLVVALLGVLLPTIALSLVVLSEVPPVFAGPGIQNLIAKLNALHIGPITVGPELAKATGDIASWASMQAVAVAASVGRAAINLVIAMLGLYYLLRSGDSAWKAIAAHLPFSLATTDRLRERFQTVTEATLIDIVLTAVLQGSLVAGAFALVGIESALLWGTVAAVASVLPVLGGSLVWVPGTIVLALNHRTGAAITLGLLGVIVISNIDNVVRPMVFKKVSSIHPLTTLVGAFAGVQYFGLVGVLLGPLALAYFFELLIAFTAEYADAAA